VPEPKAFNEHLQGLRHDRTASNMNATWDRKLFVDVAPGWNVSRGSARKRAAVAALDQDAVVRAEARAKATLAQDAPKCAASRPRLGRTSSAYGANGTILLAHTPATALKVYHPALVGGLEALCARRRFE
jgi:hypothetical protein